MRKKKDEEPKEPKVKIIGIKVMWDGIELSMTIAEAKDLYQQLRAIFDGGYSVITTSSYGNTVHDK